MHSDIAAEYLPRALGELRESGVELRVDGRTRTLAGGIGDSLGEATEEDWATEYHALILSVKVVDSVEEGIEHINRYGTGHSEAIVTGSVDSAQAFTSGVDAAAVYVNASTRFTDGAVFGMGAEIGNSTQKLHARGPDRAARAHHLQVRGRRLRAGPRVAGLRVGILGGAFNPPHIGHMVCAQEALVQLELERVVFMPVGEAPHREIEQDPGAEARLEMAELAVADDERFEASRMELDRDGPSYTADTLEALHKESPDDELFLILGGDQAAALGSWHEPEKVLELATVVVFERMSWGRNAIGIKIGRLPGARQVRYLDMPLIQVSSSAIRRRVRHGLPIRYLVPDKVADYITSNDLYGAGRAEEAVTP